MLCGVAPGLLSEALAWGARGGPGRPSPCLQKARGMGHDFKSPGGRKLGGWTECPGEDPGNETTEGRRRRADSISGDSRSLVTRDRMGGPAQWARPEGLGWGGHDPQAFRRLGAAQKERGLEQRPR